MTLDEAIKHCEEVAKHEEWMYISELQTTVKCTGEHGKCAADHRQLAEWLKELKEAKGIIRVCNRVLGYLLECEIESTLTRHEVETLLKNITEYLSGGNKNAE